MINLQMSQINDIIIKTMLMLKWVLVVTHKALCHPLP